MVRINNDFDSAVYADIYYKDKFIGRCKNYAAFLDIRRQIKNEHDSNYSFEYNGKRYKFDENGTEEEWPKGMWDTYLNILLDLL